MGVIADDRQVESLAGIMGGDSTAVSDETHTFMLKRHSGGLRRLPGGRDGSIFRPMLAIDLSAVSIRPDC